MLATSSPDGYDRIRGATAIESPGHKGRVEKTMAEAQIFERIITRSMEQSSSSSAGY